MKKSKSQATNDPSLTAVTLTKEQAFQLGQTMGSEWAATAPLDEIQFLVEKCQTTNEQLARNIEYFIECESKGNRDEDNLYVVPFYKTHVQFSEGFIEAKAQHPELEGNATSDDHHDPEISVTFPTKDDDGDAINYHYVYPWLDRIPNTLCRAFEDGWLNSVRDWNAQKAENTAIQG